jgi:endonuclease-8
VPEGDTLWRAARTLHGALAGQQVTGFASSLPEVAAVARGLRVAGRTLDAVEARGKHLLVRFSGGVTLHTHLGLHGAWHLYRTGSRWQRSPARARAVVRTATAVAVCFDAPVVEWIGPLSEAAHPSLASLGPDLLATGFDAAAAVRGLRARGDDEIAVALLDQRALCGIGNVYKSELLFLCGMSPFRLVRDLDDATLALLVDTARTLLRRNLGPGARRTTAAGQRSALFVYGRTGRGCLRCRTKIESRAQGEQARTTYWCPRCQFGAALAPRA